MKYKVGEICEVRSRAGRYEGWRECEIAEVNPEGGTSAEGDVYHYILHDGHCTIDRFLRKKHQPPKDQWTKADEEFIDELKGLLPITPGETLKQDLFDALKP